MSQDFPFTSSVKESSATAELPLFKMYSWNFEKNCFNRDSSGNLILLTGNPALRIWVEKAIRTERYSWLAYSWAYGSEIKTLVGSVLSLNEIRSELRRFIVEALMVNPYIKSVDSVTIEEDKHGRLAKINVELTTVYGKMTV